MKCFAAPAAGFLFSLTTALSAFAQTPIAKPTMPALNKPAVPARPIPKQMPPIAAKAPTVKLPANVVIRVGSRDITGQELTTLLGQFGGQPLLQQIVQSAALEQEAKRLGVTVTDIEVRRAVQDAKDQFVKQQFQSGVPMSFKEIAARDGITDELISWSVRRRVLAEKTFSRTVERQIQPLTKQIKVAHIIFSTLPTAPPVSPNTTDPTPEDAKKREADAKAKADQTLVDLKSGKIGFEAAAKQFSADTETKENGGELPWTSKEQLDRLAPEFANAAYSLQKVGDIAGPIKTNYGYHLIKLVKLGKDATVADKNFYRQQIIDSQLKSQGALNRWLGGLVQSAVIVRNPNPAGAFKSGMSGRK